MRFDYTIIAFLAVTNLRRNLLFEGNLIQSLLFSLMDISSISGISYLEFCTFPLTIPASYVRQIEIEIFYRTRSYRLIYI